MGYGSSKPIPNYGTISWEGEYPFPTIYQRLKKGYRGSKPIPAHDAKGGARQAS